MFDLERSIRDWRNELALQRSLSTNQIDELEDHLRSTYRSLVEIGLLLPEAWAHAREALGTSTELSTEFRKVDGVAWRRFLVAGWAMFAVSFFLPVHDFGLELFNFEIADGVLPGFQAFLLALKGEAGVVGIVSALTNAVMLITMWRIANRGRNAIVVLAGLAATAALTNAWWLTSVDVLADLRVGYYVWWASFGFASAGLMLRARAVVRRTMAVSAS